MFLILFVDIVIVATGFLLTKKFFPKFAARVLLWSIVFVLLVIGEFVYINKAINDYYSKQHYLSKEELTGLLNRVEENIVKSREEAFANSDLVFEGFPLRIEKLDKNKQYIPNAIDVMSKTQYLRDKSAAPKFVVIFDIQRQIKGQIQGSKFNVLVQDPKMTFAFAGFDIGRDGTINTRVPFRVYINSKNEMIYNDMVLKNMK